MTISHIFSQITRYKSVWLWFVADSYWRFFRLVTKIIFYMAGSMVMLVSALGLIYKYVNGLEQGQQVEIFSITYQYQSSVEILFLVILATSFLFGGAAFLRYISGITALELGRRYEEHCILRSASFLAIAHKTESLSIWLNEAGKLIQSGPRFCGRVARLSIMSVLPSMTFVVTLTLLAYLDFFVTLVVVAIIAISIPFLYAINVKGARYSRTLEQTTPAASQARRGIIESCIENGSFVPPESEQMREYAKKGPLFDNFNAYIGRLRAVANGLFVTQVMLGVGIVVIIWLMGADIIETGSGWGALATYLVALRINLASFSSASTNFTGVNRFYPQVLRYFSFVRDVNVVLAKSPEYAQDYISDLTITTDIQSDAQSNSPSVEYDWKSFIPNKNQRLALEVPITAPDWYIRLVVAEVFSGTEDNEVYIVSSGTSSNDGLMTNFEVDDVEEDGSDIFGRPSTTVSGEAPEPATKDLDQIEFPVVEEILSAVKAGYSLIVIDQTEWLFLDNQTRAALNRALIGINLILLSRGSDMSPDKNGITFAIATDGNGLMVQSNANSFEKMIPILEILRGTSRNNNLGDYGGDHLED